MSGNCRFSLDEKRNLIDAVNVANSGKIHCEPSEREDEKHLRERVLITRLLGIVDKLIVKLRPMHKLPSGTEYRLRSECVDSISYAVLYMNSGITLEHVRSRDVYSA